MLFYVKYQLASALRCPLDDRIGDLASCLRVKPIPQLISAADKNIGAPILTYPFSPVVDGTLVPFDINMKNGAGNVQSIKDMLGKFDILCGVKEGPVLPKVGRQLFNNIDMDRFVTAVIKLTMRMEAGSEPTPEVKKVCDFLSYRCTFRIVFYFMFLILQEVLKAINHMYGTLPPMRELISDFLIVYPMIDLLNLHSESGRNTFFYVFKDYDPLKLLKVSYENSTYLDFNIIELNLIYCFSTTSYHISSVAKSTRGSTSEILLTYTISILLFYSLHF